MGGISRREGIEAGTFEYVGGNGRKEAGRRGELRCERGSRIGDGEGVACRTRRRGVREGGREISKDVVHMLGGLTAVRRGTGSV